MTGNGKSQRYRTGLATMYQGGEERTNEFLASLSDVCPELADHVVSYIYGHLHQRPQLGTVQRELCTLAVLASLGGCEREIKLHVGAAVRMGVPPEQIMETFLHAMPYVGVPRSVNAVLAARDVLSESGLLPVAAPSRSGDRESD